MDGRVQVKSLTHALVMIYEHLFRKFICLGNEARRSATLRLASRHGSLNLSKSGLIAEEMGSVRIARRM